MPAREREKGERGREESGNACDYADQWAMALFMALSGSLYRAASDSTRAPADFFYPDFVLYDHIHLR